MPLYAIGDLAASISQLHHASRLKGSISQLTNELASGQTETPHDRVGGNHALLSDIATRQSRLDSYKLVATEASVTAGAMQASLSVLADRGQALSNVLLTTDMNTSQPAQAESARLARTALNEMVGALNTAVGGVQVFSGDKVHTRPLASADQILSGLTTALSGLTDATDIEQAADSWFGPGGAFETNVYQGSTTARAPLRVDEHTQVNLDLKADHPDIRSLLKDTALLALSTDASLSLSEGTIRDLQNGIGQNLTQTQDRVTGLQADLGIAERQIEDSGSRAAAQQLSLETVRTRLLEADPFETAARLEDAQFRLNALYTVTARSASLRLVNYL